MLASYSDIEGNFLICNKKREELSFFSSVPPQGLDCATCSRQSCAHLVYTLPSSLEGRRRQGSRSLSGHKKNENLSILVSYPLRGCSMFYIVRFKCPFRNIWFLMGSTLLSHFVAIGGEVYLANCILSILIHTHFSMDS